MRLSNRGSIKSNGRRTVPVKGRIFFKFACYMWLSCTKKKGPAQGCTMLLFPFGYDDGFLWKIHGCCACNNYNSIKTYGEEQGKVTKYIHVNPSCFHHAIGWIRRWFPKVTRPTIWLQCQVSSSLRSVLYQRLRRRECHLHRRQRTSVVLSGKNVT